MHFLCNVLKISELQNRYFKGYFGAKAQNMLYNIKRLAYVYVRIYT